MDFGIEGSCRAWDMYNIAVLSGDISADELQRAMMTYPSPGEALTQLLQTSKAVCDFCGGSERVFVVTPWDGLLRDGKYENENEGVRFEDFNWYT